MLPGMPGVELPVTPDIFLCPAASVSAVFSQSGAGSDASNDDEKPVAGACAAAVVTEAAHNAAANHNVHRIRRPMPASPTAR
jgi:hypothetical protein